MKEKLKERLATLSDGIIAIILTIMVLELPIKTINGTVDYLQLSIAIGIYFVSFCFVANIWYQHTVLFNNLDSVTNKIVILDLILLFILSLIPTFTKLITEDTDKISVTIYGILSVVITMLFNYMVDTLTKTKYNSDEDVRKIFTNIYGRNNGIIILVYLIAIILGIFYPKIALVLYFIIPIKSFFNHVGENEEFQNISEMNQNGRSFYLQMSREDQMKYRSILIKYFRNLRKTNNPEEQTRLWNEFAQSMKQNFNVSEEQLHQWIDSEKRRRVNYRHQ
ncbi:TMEM175 family protein [Lentilactobacillus laojiaonis]|uniref:TMEM175 family protein n=1 Tax=Lentilactobacillus laojiaonis TaxID=2883998 RepID=UPI001D0B4EE0|nr:TMEM175 family protein [Lentilactobacillus laojiaonis]UDM32558.1 TMEM175 family protein [Lentilactobacillus laojiaonis]